MLTVTHFHTNIFSLFPFLRHRHSCCDILIFLIEKRREVDVGFVKVDLAERCFEGLCADFGLVDEFFF
jgi:hypothetical protein